MGMNLAFALISGVIAWALWRLPEADMNGVAAAFGGLCAWQLYCAVSVRAPAARIVMRLGGFSWTIEDFCRGWLITGETGSGKTTGGINAMLWEVSKNYPSWGGVCVDDKGLYGETLQTMLRELGRADDLIVLQVRPDNAPSDWQPKHTFNFLENPHLPYSAKAKIVCDVASSLGQRSDQSFFRTQAQVQMEFAFRVLEAAGLPVALDGTYELLTSEKCLQDTMKRVAQRNGPHAEELLDHYQHAFKSQPAEQLGGVKTTVTNYLKFFTEPDIAAVFCPAKATVSMADVDRGKKICVLVPQRFHVERRYVNTLLKLSFYAHALRRFDRTAIERAQDNLLIFWAGEAPKVVTASDDGLSDYGVVDVIREAKATFVGDTQSYSSLIPPLGDEKKAKVLIANLANRITFKAADEDSAKIAADTLGKRKVKKRTYGYSGGRSTSSWTDEDRYWIEPHQLRRLRKFQAVVQHCELGFRVAKLPPRGADGKIPAWYRK